MYEKIYNFLCLREKQKKRQRYGQGYAVAFCCVGAKAVLYWWRCPSPFWEQKEVSCMAQILTDIIVAVVAQVVADRLCKWLDSYCKGK